MKPRHAYLQLLLACAMIALGGVLLGLQVDGNGALAGTGYTALGVAALVALIASLIQASVAGRVPRDRITGLSIVCGYCGLTFVVAGVLAPGGTWMFFEVLLLFWVLARRRTLVQTSGPEIGGGTLLLVTLMLLFRLWITWKGSESDWALVSVDVPILSWLPMSWLDPVKTISLGSFTPHELGFPATGLDFPLSMTLWSAGFALCASGLWLKSRAAREHENDRIDDLIHTLPPAPAALVVRLVPEEEWEALGLHGLSERLLARRIEALVGRRIQTYREVQIALARTPLPAIGAGEGFVELVSRALERGSEPAPAPSTRSAES